MEDEGMLVTKEYVKGSKNLYVSPAVSAFNRTADSANKTVMALIKIIKEFNVDGMTDNEDLLLKTINGEEEDEWKHMSFASRISTRKQHQNM